MSHVDIMKSIEVLKQNIDPDLALQLLKPEEIEVSATK